MSAACDVLALSTSLRSSSKAVHQSEFSSSALVCPRPELRKTHNPQVENKEKALLQLAAALSASYPCRALCESFFANFKPLDENRGLR